MKAEKVVGYSLAIVNVIAAIIIVAMGWTDSPALVVALMATMSLVLVDCVHQG